MLTWPTALLAALVLLLAGELIARVRFVQRRRRELAVEAQHRAALHFPPWIWHPLLGQVHAPNYTSPTCATDARGFRRVQGSTPGRPVVLLAGGSMAFGTGAADGGTIADALQAALPAMTVVNVAQSAFTSSQTLIQVALFTADFAPAVCLVLDGWNDFYAATKPGWAPQLTSRTRQFADWYQQTRARALREASFRTALIDDLRKILSTSKLLGALRRSAPTLPRRASAVDSTQIVRAAQLYAENVRSLSALLAARGCALIVIGTPSLLDTSKRLSREEQTLADALAAGTIRFHEHVTVAQWATFTGEVARRLAAFGLDYHPGIHVLDALDAERSAFADSGHLTPAGQHVIAQVMAQALTASLASASIR
jgi:hypothetical protein